jgi:hypothetical protein
LLVRASGVAPPANKIGINAGDEPRGTAGNDTLRGLGKPVGKANPDRLFGDCSDGFIDARDPGRLEGAG